MSLVVFSMPDSPEQQRRWLERELMGLRLDRLVAELSVIHGDTGRSTLEQVIGPYRSDIAQHGLQGIPDDALSQLLRQPRLLLELQEYLLTEGGPYWDGVLQQQPQIDDVLAKTQRHVAALVGKSKPATTEPPKRRDSYWPGVLLALAASVALVMGIWWQLQSPPVWGWNQPSALLAEGSAADYLNHLADGAQQWFDQRRDSSEELTRRLTEMRRGCDRLIAAPHTALSEEDRVWLVQRCKAWSGKFDEQLAQLKSGEKDSDQVRQEADATVKKLVQALRTRAAGRDA